MYVFMVKNKIYVLFFLTNKNFCSIIKNKKKCSTKNSAGVLY